MTVFKREISHGANGDQKSLGATSEREEKLVEFSLGTVSTE